MHGIFVGAVLAGLLFGFTNIANAAQDESVVGQPNQQIEPQLLIPTEAEAPQDPATVWLILIPLACVLPLPWKGVGRRSRILARDRLI